ncbi:MAG: pilus assembly protein [Actinomycetota bacterium]|nr:pilus assembly protein [Actinomycetota bacterium]
MRAFRFRRRRRPRLTPSSGQAMVEFALVLLPMLLLMFGLLDMGRLVFINNAVSEGAREGSRWGSVAGRSTDSSAIQTQILSVMTAVPDPEVTVTCERNGSAPFSCRTGDVLLITVSSRVEMMIPIIGQIVGPMTVSATSRVAVHQ